MALYLLTCAQHACRPYEKAALNDRVPHNAGRLGRLSALRLVWLVGERRARRLFGRSRRYALTFVVTAATQLIAAGVAGVDDARPRAGLVPRRRAPTEDPGRPPWRMPRRRRAGSFVVDDRRCARVILFCL